jgi:poly(A) polymerase
VSQLAEQRSQPRVLARAEHSLSRSLVSENALKVLYRLHRSGFLAYLVGGAVRDLLIGRRPKDFDVGTNARPQQVRQLFRNSRLIGRRFRLARVGFSGEVIEVATFRRSPEPPEMEDGETTDVLAPAVEGEEFGTPEEDAWRRDFTVNGLFYNIADFSVIDHVGGLEDLEAGIIRTIGDPRLRFAEDPVRMMRAVEYAARLAFRMDDDTAEAIATLQPEIHRAAPARIAYELSESLSAGHAARIFRGLERHGLLEHILPQAHDAVNDAGEGMLWSLLETADAKLTHGEGLLPETLLALLLVPWFLSVTSPSDGGLARADLEVAIHEQVDAMSLRLAFSNHRAHLLRTGFLTLARLTAPPRSSKAVIRTLRQEAFPLALQVARLVAQATGRFKEPLEVWEKAVARLRAGQSPLDELRRAGTRSRHRRWRGRRHPQHGGGGGGATP